MIAELQGCRNPQTYAAGGGCNPGVIVGTMNVLARISGGPVAKVLNMLLSPDVGAA